MAEPVLATAEPEIFQHEVHRSAYEGRIGLA